MDTPTQFLLGASVAGVILGRKLGPRSLLYGGLTAVLPDLDIFVPMGNEIDNMTYHRGASHSFLVHTVFAPLLAFAITRFDRKAKETGTVFYITIWLCLITHSILDALTTYGTQIWWPLQVGAPAAFPAVFIIDPVYSLLLLFGVVSVWVWRKKPNRGLRINQICLVFSAIYLTIGIMGNLAVKARAQAHPAFKGKRVHVQPTPFNIVVWQVLGVGKSDYVSGLTSVLGSCEIRHIASHKRSAEPPDGLKPSASVRRLEWFTDGFFSYNGKADILAITDLRIGYHPAFVFSFDFARKTQGVWTEFLPVHQPRGPTGAGRVKVVFDKLEETIAGCK